MNSEDQTNGFRKIDHRTVDLSVAVVDIMLSSSVPESGLTQFTFAPAYDTIKTFPVHSLALPSGYVLMGLEP
jgi:hypothetical protein